MHIQQDNKNINIAAIVLAGGKGTRLFPLTLNRCKPAVAYGGRYRLIDVPISNSLNSNIRNIYVIAQYLPVELQKHLTNTYQFDSFFPGSLDLLIPQEKPNGERIWFEGTADAIRKNLDKILEMPVDYFLILSGDQLYNIDFQQMFNFAKEKNADLTIASLPVEAKDTNRLGILKTDKDDKIIDFYEKPQSKEILDALKLDEHFLKRWKVSDNKKYLGSMGIYIFKREALKKILTEDGREDFGKHLIPSFIHKAKTCAFVYEGYWEDIGTVDSFYNANIALTNPSFGLKIYDESNPIYTKAHHLPGAKINSTIINSSIICEGSIVSAKEITNSMVGLRSCINKGTIIHDSVLLGNDFYNPPTQNQTLPKNFEIGENCLIQKAIIDENVKIGNEVQLINKNNLSTFDGNGIYVRDGIIVVSSGTYIPDGFIF